MKGRPCRDEVEGRIMLWERIRVGGCFGAESAPVLCASAGIPELCQGFLQGSNVQRYLQVRGSVTRLLRAARDESEATVKGCGDSSITIIKS